MTTLQKILIGVGIALVIFLAFYFTIKHYKNINEELLLELNKKGELIKYSDSLQSYTAYINTKRADSLIALNSDLAAALKEAKGKTELVYVYNTETKYVNLSATTSWDTTIDKQFATRTALYDDKWIKFKSTYRTKFPYEFMIDSINILDSLVLVQTIDSFGRKTIYVKNKNPYTHINDLQAFVDPKVITNTILDKEYWEWMLSYTYTPGIKTTNVLMGVYSPFGIGIVGGYSNIPQNFSLNYNFGLSFIKKF